MPTSEIELKSVLERFNADLSYRKMMGEYLLYADGVLFGGVYDGRLLIKDTKEGRKAVPDAPLQLPYAGAKPMLFIDGDMPEAKISELVEITVKSLRR